MGAAPGDAGRRLTAVLPADPADPSGSSRTADVLTRAGLILTATGVVSAATVRHAINERDDLVFAYGFVLYLGLILFAVPRRQRSVAPLLAFGAFAVMYLSAAFTASPISVGLALYVVAGGLAFLATPSPYRALTVAAFALWTPGFRLFGPDPLGGFYPPSNVVATTLALAFLVVMLLARRGDDDERVRRVGLGLLAVAIVALISERHNVVATPSGIAPDDLWALIAVAVLPALAIVRIPRRARDALATGVALGAYLLVGLALILGKGYHVDSVAIVHRAADVVIAGHDPYRDLDAMEALRHFGLGPELGTQLEDGSQVRSYNYPALSFLVVVPFVAAGLTDIRFIYLAEVIALVLLLIRQVRVPWRPLVAAAVVGNAVIARQNVLAGVDPLWAVCTVTAFLFIGRRRVSPVLMGLAWAIRQPAWFFAPFYLLAVWKRDGRREAVRRGAIASVAAILPNLPFFVHSPGDFLGGVLAPMFGPLEPYGVGFIRFAMDGALPFFPRAVYGLLSAAAMIALLWLLWRNWRRIPNGALAFPSAVLWFAWRSLQNYFGFAGILAMAGDEDIITGEVLGPDPGRS